MSVAQSQSSHEARMSSDACGRQCCIIDTSALINLCKVNVGGRLAIEWILQDFCFLIPKKIFDEGCTYASHQDFANLYYSTIQGFVRPVTETCEVIIDDQIELLPSDQRTLVDDGERIGAAFAFEQSRQQVQYILFVTNDFKASPPLQNIFDLLQIGNLRTAYDILVFLASRHPHDIPLGELDVALRELNSIVRDSSEHANSETQAPDDVLLRHLQTISRSSDAFKDF